MKKYLRIAVPIVCLILVIRTILFLIPACGFIIDSLRFKAKLDNEYINNNYANWKTVTIDQAFTFHIPGEWTVINQEGFEEFKNNQGETIAYASFISQSIKYYDKESLISEIVGEEVEFVNYEYFDNAANIRASVLTKSNFSGESNSYEFFGFSLYNANSEACVIVLPVSKIVPYDDVREICEAIMYSYYYPEDI